MDTKIYVARLGHAIYVKKPNFQTGHKTRRWDAREKLSLTCMTLMGRPVSFANCSLMCLVGFGVDEKAVFRISNCFAFMVVRGPRRFEPAPPSPLPPPAPPSGLLFSVWLSLVSGSPSREPSTDQSRAATSLSYDHRHRHHHHLGLIKFAESLRSRIATKPKRQQSQPYCESLYLSR